MVKQNHLIDPVAVSTWSFRRPPPAMEATQRHSDTRTGPRGIFQSFAHRARCKKKNTKTQENK